MSSLYLLLLIATPATPLVVLALCGSQARRSLLSSCLWVAPLPALGAALMAIAGQSATFAAPAIGCTLFIDKAAGVLLLVVAILWIGAGLTAARRDARDVRFRVCWLLTMAGSFGVFVAADLLTFYLVYALVSIPAFGLIVRDGDAASKRAAGVYMAFTILGEAFLLAAFALLAAGEPNGSLQIHDVMAALPGSPWRDGALLLIIAGFGLKIALVPMHGWMPLTYTAAPIPAAAALSGAAVKAGVIGLIRFLPFDTALPDWGEALTALGFISAFYGVAVGITQHNPKTVLAYSSISQMGVIAAVMGMGLASAIPGTALDSAFYAAHHVLVKGALFLSIGVAAVASQKYRPLVMWLSAIMALSLAGLPMTGGWLAKLVVKAPLGDGIAGTLADLSAAATTLLMLHFLMLLARMEEHSPQTNAQDEIDAPWLAVAISSVVVPWVLYPVVVGGLGETLTASAILKSLWPILLGGALAYGLRPWNRRLLSVPEGDIINPMEAAFRAALRLGETFARLDLRLRQWPAATISLGIIALLLAAAARASR
jgi:formate hydrogenlyase subunit 3/multisubunit Na+/H+ antiporter MnhD subunit